MKKLSIVICLAAAITLASSRTSAFAEDHGTNMAYASRGVGRILGSAMAIPAAVIQDSQRVMFPFGIVTGVIRGTVGMIGGIIGGTCDVARGSAPYAKYAALAL
ncbi:MAG: hypothetical protein BWY42_00120 [Candidatus Omnitrophica bacterium ADurb.Bin277]|nr:MAG: hypothetical protein BWY42_00120 [Candidatus Omnitrophica bacterium ADurb.Bin277]